jgi:hypothetical protein
MSKKTDQAMLKLPLADVAEWLRQELEDHTHPPDVVAAMDEADRLVYSTWKNTILRLIAKLGH